MESHEWTRAQKLKGLLFMVFVALIFQIGFIGSKLYIYQNMYLSGRYKDRTTLGVHELSYGERIRNNIGELIQWIIPRGSAPLSPADSFMRDRSTDNQSLSNISDNACPLVPPQLGKSTYQLYLYIPAHRRIHDPKTYVRRLWLIVSVNLGYSFNVHG